MIRLQYRIDNTAEGSLREMLKLRGQKPDGVLPVLKVRLRRSLIDSGDPEILLDELESRIREMEVEAYDTLKDLGL